MTPLTTLAPDHGINDPDVQRDQAHGLPGAEALLAGSLALMTAFAQSRCDGCRTLIVKKIISNLFMLSQHPVAAPGFKVMAMGLHGNWVQQLQQLQTQGEETPPEADQHRALWHATPEVLQ
jgi:hypothetical protein